MRSPHYTITPRDVQLHATHLLQRHLRFADHGPKCTDGPKCTAGLLWAVLLYAASRISCLRRRQSLAIDLHLVPYHGQPLHDEREVYRSAAKDGTSHFHAYATAYVTRTGQRFTVALARVTKGQPLQEVIRELLRQAARAGVRPRYLLLDRGFCSVEVIRRACAVATSLEVAARRGPLELQRRLQAIPGIGPWTVAEVTLRAELKQWQEATSASS